MSQPTHGACWSRRGRRGTACLWLSVGANTDVATLRGVFGSAAHAAIQRIGQLRPVIGPLFRSALRSAEVRWPVRT
jgi:nitric oxide reductase NorD protein